MRSKLLTTSALFAAVILAQPGAAHAQSWKRLCVNGGATGGANNATWQKINASAAGGGTWKKAGGCITPPPPPEPTPPTPTLPAPFAGAELDSIPSVAKAFGSASVGINISTDGTWAAFGNDVVQQGHEQGRYKPNSGRWNSGGRNANDFEIYWTGTFQPTGPGLLPSVFSASTAEGQWSILGAGWSFSFADDPTPCSQGDYALIKIMIRLKADPSQVFNGQVVPMVAGGSSHCYG
jgi:hypothetical protein